MTNQIITIDTIQNKILNIRGQKVMLDSDIASLYGVELKRMNEQVNRNINRFPDNFRFQLTKDEYENLKSQIATSSSEDSLRSQIATLEKGKGEHSKYLPFVYTEQGVSMLSAVLRSDTAVQVSIQIMNAFVGMRKFINANAEIFARIDKVERKQVLDDNKFEQIFNALEQGKPEIEKGIFFNGQVFDAHVFVSDLIKSANSSIKIIDNWTDETVLTQLAKKSEGVKVKIYSKRFTSQQVLDAERFNEQYGGLELIEFDKSHDRFIIIDNHRLLLIGASLKDLGKKIFGFSEMSSELLKLNELLETQND